MRRNCLTFQPTERDRNDLRMLGADASLLAAVDECARRKAPVRTTLRPPPPLPPLPPLPPPPPPPAPQPPPVFQVQRVVVTVSPERSGFVIANGMRQYLTVTVPPKAAPGKVDCR